MFLNKKINQIAPKILLILGISVLLASCVSRDPLLDIYVKEFDEMYNIAYKGSYKFTDTADYAGVCYMALNNNPFNLIVINREYWDRATEIEREQLVFHELGHCAAGLGHNTSTLPDGCPGSIMYPYTIFDYCYAKHRNYYLDNLLRAEE